MLDIQKQQAGLERNYEKLPRFQEILADQVRKEISRKRCRNNFLGEHYRERQRRMAFMFLKEHCQKKLFERRALRTANMMLTKKAKDRLFQAWRTVRYREKANRLLHAYTRECEVQVEEHKKRKLNLTAQWATK